jgi:hypothetical protein
MNKKYEITIEFRIIEILENLECLICDIYSDPITIETLGNAKEYIKNTHLDKIKKIIYLSNKLEKIFKESDKK